MHQGLPLHVPRALQVVELISSTREKCVEVNLISLPKFLHPAVCLQSFIHPFIHPWLLNTVSDEIKAAKLQTLRTCFSNTFHASSEALACFIYEKKFLPCYWSYSNIFSHKMALIFKKSQIGIPLH